MITAPFNFVPLSDKVFFPPWADKVSHDIPFEDGESGEIEITITAKSPIFIRDSQEKKRFCNYNGQYYIPGSSVKGMVRNVLEIMSFSKMSFVDNKKYSVRDLGNPELYRDKFKTDQIYCGWLRKDLDSFVIDDCGYPGRISHQEIDKATGTNFSHSFSDGFGGSEEEKLARYKYSIVPEDKLQGYFKYKKKNNVKQKVYHYDETQQGEFGTVVFTGQPTKRKNSGKKSDGKGFEFIFFDIEDTIEIDQKTFENFKFAYFDGRRTQPEESKDWTMWKEKLYNGARVPVFFRKDKYGKILDFGLSYLYKLPYKNSVLDGIPHIHKTISDIPDLSETIFGYINAITKNALKGRVQFSHFKAIGNPTVSSKKVLILGTPRASYYPIYIEQSKGQTYKTYMNKEFKVSGWKRYPIHKHQPSTPNEEESTVATTFYPLNHGVMFKGKMRFHNLKPQELGAVLSALTFHNTQGCYHNIGLAKSYGYGKVEIKIDNGRIYGADKIKELDEEQEKNYLKAYEKTMCKSIENWYRSEQITELLTMATEPNSDNHLKYMRMEPGDRNEFVSQKASGRNPLNSSHYLNRYSTLPNVNIKTLTLLNEECKKEKIINVDEHIKKDWEVIETTKDVDLVTLFIKKYPKSQFLKNAEALINDSSKKQQLSPLEKEQIAYRTVISADRIYEYERFLEKYPSTIYKNEIESKIQKLKDIAKKEEIQKKADEEWEKIKESNEINKLEKFISDFGETSLCEKAQERIDSINKRLEKERIAKENAEKAKKNKQTERANMNKNILNAISNKNIKKKKKKK